MGEGLHVMVGNPDELWQSWLLWPASPLSLQDQITALAGEGECVFPRVLHPLLSGLCPGAGRFPCQLSQLTPVGYGLDPRSPCPWTSGAEQCI